MKQYPTLQRRVEVGGLPFFDPGPVGKRISTETQRARRIQLTFSLDSVFSTRQSLFVRSSYSALRR